MKANYENGREVGAAGEMERGNARKNGAAKRAVQSKDGAKAQDDTR